METLEVFQTLGIALLLGLLVGMQREMSEDQIGGFRTFAIVTLFGTVCAYLALEFSPWILAFGFLGVIGVIVAGNAIKIKAGKTQFGMTTEVSMLLMFAVGAYLTVGSQLVAASIAGGTAILLYLKPQFKGVLARLNHNDIRAIMQFVLITLIILPLLPNETFGPFDVFNPRRVWLLVVLIVGISLGGYLAFKFLGQRAGTLLGGLLGGLISSTATTVSYAKKSTGDTTFARNAAVVVILASAMMYPRVAVEIVIMAPDYFFQMIGPVVVLFVVNVALSLWMYRRVRDMPFQMPEQKNPSELSSALSFGLVYVSVLFLVAATTEFFDESALFAVAALSGLADMDAITLSTAQMVQEGSIHYSLGWRLILTAAIANSFFKFGIITMLGHRMLQRDVAVAFGLIALTAFALIIAGTVLANQGTPVHLE